MIVKRQCTNQHFYTCWYKNQDFDLKSNVLVVQHNLFSLRFFKDAELGRIFNEVKIRIFERIAVIFKILGSRYQMIINKDNEQL